VKPLTFLSVCTQIQNTEFFICRDLKTVRLHKFDFHTSTMNETLESLYAFTYSLSGTLMKM
jgi:hypothetical protein